MVLELYVHVEKNRRVVQELYAVHVEKLKIPLTKVLLGLPRW